ncbi:hypothetical protein NUACC21_13870 [Scytonema sp. NUACC21]
MLQKAFIIGVCFVVFIGCTDKILQNSEQSELEVSTKKTQQESESLEQERIRLVAEEERKTKKQVIIIKY